MSYGFASYGMPQTYSVFSAYPGPSYGTNFPPYGIMPGRYGVGLWRPGFVAPGTSTALLTIIRRLRSRIGPSRSDIIRACRSTASRRLRSEFTPRPGTELPLRLVTSGTICRTGASVHSDPKTQVRFA